MLPVWVNARAFVERVTDERTELLLQVRDRPGEARAWELPGGRVEEFEPILDALTREVYEETGLRVTEILGGPALTVWSGDGARVECLVPFCAYQTTSGPVDSAGFFFRCRAEGELTTRGDGAIGHTWFAVTELEQWFRQSPDDFDWLTQGALHYYLEWWRASRNR